MSILFVSPPWVWHSLLFTAGYCTSPSIYADLLVFCMHLPWLSQRKIVQNLNFKEHTLKQLFKNQTPRWPASTLQERPFSTHGHAYIHKVQQALLMHTVSLSVSSRSEDVAGESHSMVLISLWNPTHARTHKTLRYFCSEPYVDRSATFREPSHSHSHWLFLFFLSSPVNWFQCKIWLNTMI